MSRSRLSAFQSFQVLKLIESNGKMNGEFFVYNDGWSDSKIASDLNVDVDSVFYRRKKVFGNLKLYNSNIVELVSNISSLELSIKDLKVSNFKLDDRMRCIEKAVNVLLNEMSSVPNKSKINPDTLVSLKKYFNTL